MASTSALTWAAARSGEPDWKFLSHLTSEDHAKIDIAYQEWRARIAAGEKQPQIDWRAVELPKNASEPMAEVVATEPETAAPALDAAHSTVDHTGDEDATPWEDDPDVSDAIEQVEEILSEPAPDPEYVSLADFNCEPSEDEMKAMLESAGSDLEGSGQTEASESDAEETTEDAQEEAPETATDDAIPIERRISNLPKDVDAIVYEDILSCLGNDINMAITVTEAVIRDHTHRHRGTASQRQFLAWLNTKGGKEHE